MGTSLVVIRKEQELFFHFPHQALSYWLGDLLQCRPALPLAIMWQFVENANLYTQVLSGFFFMSGCSTATHLRVSVWREGVQAHPYYAG